MKKQIGNFKINVSESGYPVWIELSYEGMTSSIRINHREICDLEYAIKFAKNRAIERLGPKERTEVH